jgi:hypothetical protein
MTRQISAPLTNTLNNKVDNVNSPAISVQRDRQGG